MSEDTVICINCRHHTVLECPIHGIRLIKETLPTALALPISGPYKPPRSNGVALFLTVGSLVCAAVGLIINWLA